MAEAGPDEALCAGKDGIKTVSGLASGSGPGESRPLCAMGEFLPELEVDEDRVKSFKVMGDVLRVTLGV